MRKRAAVIGSGFGGLAAAIRLAHAGLDVVLFEARDKPGGRAYVYEDRGFVFDAGPTVITAPHCLEELFALRGGRLSDAVEMLPVRPFYRLIWPDGDVFDYDGDLFERIRARSPRDAEGYLRFVDYSRKVFEKGYLDLVDEPFLRFSDMIRVAPDLLRLRADRSVYSAVARFVEDEHLRQALSFHALLVGGNPFETSAIYALIHYLERHWGVFFPKGGTGALVAALCREARTLGVDLRLSSPVESIQLSNGQHLVAANGQTERFDVVVSNADVHHTYSKLYQDVPVAQETARKLEKLDWSMSLFVLYFGTDRPYDLAHHTVVFGPRYRELLDEIFHGHQLPADHSLYLHAPSVTDPSLAPPGCGSFYVLSPVPHLGHAKLDWETVGPAYAQRILASLEQHMPNLRQHIVTQRWFTPRDFQQELGAYSGSAFSVAPQLTQSAWFRPHNRDPNIPGLYLVGAGTHPGAGVPGVINSAKATVKVILSDLNRAKAAA